MNAIATVLLTAAPDGFAYDNAAMTRIDGREAALRCMEMYTNREGILQTIIVVADADAEETRRKIGSHLSFMGIKLITAGSGWAEQLATAAKVLKAETTHVIVHDAARPAVPFSDLDRLIETAGKYPAVALGRSLKGTLATCKIVPGAAEIAAQAIAEVFGPVLYDRPTYELAAAGKRPTAVQLIEGSPLNVRCGWQDTGYVKAMVGLLPKPKAKAALSPFEEAQW